MCIYTKIFGKCLALGGHRNKVDYHVLCSRYRAIAQGTLDTGISLEPLSSSSWLYLISISYFGLFCILSMFKCLVLSIQNNHKYHYPHFGEEETKAQINQAIFPRLQSSWVKRWDLNQEFYIQRLSQAAPFRSRMEWGSSWTHIDSSVVFGGPMFNFEELSQKVKTRI